MKKLLLAVAAFLISGVVFGQATPVWIPWSSSWTRWDGGSPVPAGGGGVTPYSGTPVLGDLICFDGTNWVSIVAGTSGDFLGANTGACPTYQALPAAGGAVSLQGASPGTPDVGNWNVTGVGTSTHDNIHATLTPGLFLSNTQAALVGQQQEYSPSFKFCGAGWNTGGGASETDCWQIFNRPIAGNPTTEELSFQASLAGAAYVERMKVNSAGKLTLGEATATDGQITLNGATSGSITIAPASGALGTITATMPAQSGTVVVNSPTDDNVNVGSGTAWQLKALPSCADSAGNHLNYTTSTNTFSCGTTSSNPAFSPATTVQIYDEFSCGPTNTSATTIGSCVNGTSVSTGGASANGTGDATAVGVASLNTSTSTTGISASGSQSVAGFLLADTAQNQTRVQVSALSSGADEYTIWYGWCDASATTNATCQKGAWFTYHDTGTTANWAIHTGKTVGGIATSDADCAIAVQAATWTTLKIRYESGVGVHFYVNGSECTNSPINTNLPTANGDQTRPYFWKIAKAAGSTQVNYLIDYEWFTETVSR